MSISNEDNVIGESIKLARDNLDWSQIELSKKSGISRSAISEIENGKARRKNMTLDTIQSIALALGVTAGDLIDGRIRGPRISSKELIDEILDEISNKRIRRPDLAQKAGVSIESLSAVLDGVIPADSKIIHSICSVLGISPNKPPKMAEIRIHQEIMGGTLVAEGVIRISSQKGEIDLKGRLYEIKVSLVRHFFLTPCRTGETRRPSPQPRRWA